MSAIISYGGGVQSTALVVLAVQGVIQADAAVFANVGDDSEHPATLTYIRDVMTPWATNRGLTIEEVTRGNWPTGDPHTLLSHLRAYDGCQACGATWEDDCTPDCPSRSNTGGDLPIPMKIEPTLAPVQRSCTKHWKLIPIRRWLIARGATVNNPTTIMLGISTDEYQRATTRRDPPVIDNPTFPLLTLGYSRNDCRQIIQQAGLPVPPKSACWFCPFHTQIAWAERRRDDPELFNAAVVLEDDLNQRRKHRDLSPVRFVTRGRLGDLPAAGDTLFDLDNPTDIGESGCDEGVCFV